MLWIYRCAANYHSLQNGNSFVLRFHWIIRHWLTWFGNIFYFFSSKNFIFFFLYFYRRLNSSFIVKSFTYSHIQYSVLIYSSVSYTYRLQESFSMGHKWFYWSRCIDLNPRKTIRTECHAFFHKPNRSVNARTCLTMSKPSYRLHINPVLVWLVSLTLSLLSITWCPLSINWKWCRRSIWLMSKSSMHR